MSQLTCTHFKTKSCLAITRFSIILWFFTRLLVNLCLLVFAEYGSNIVILARKILILIFSRRIHSCKTCEWPTVLTHTMQTLQNFTRFSRQHISVTNLKRGAMKASPTRKIILCPTTRKELQSPLPPTDLEWFKRMNIDDWGTRSLMIWRREHNQWIQETAMSLSLKINFMLKVWDKIHL